MRKLLEWAGLKPRKRDPNAIRYAGIYARTVAASLDIIPLLLLLGSISNVLMFWIFARFGQTPLILLPQPHNFSELFAQLWTARYPYLLHNLVVMLLIGIPYVACQVRFNTTPGRWLLGLAVVDSKTLQPLSPTRYVLRYISYILVLGMPLALFNKRNRALHDIVSRTVVIHTRPEGWVLDLVKKAFKKRFGKSAAIEQPVPQPPTEQRHENRN